MNALEPPTAPPHQANGVVPPNWLRWILVLPAAVGAYFVVQLINGIASEMLPVPEWYVQMFNSFAGPVALVWGGAKTAPKYRLAVAITLAALQGIALIVILTLAISSGRHSDPTWWLLTSSVVGVVGTVFVCVALKEDKTLLD